MNLNNHNDSSNQCASIPLSMRQCNHNDLTNKCTVLSDSEHASFLLSLMQLTVSKSCQKTQSFETFRKRKVYENVYQVRIVLNARKKRHKLEFEIKWMGHEETAREPKTNLHGEACEFLLYCIFSILSSKQTDLITVSVQEAINLEGLISQKENFVTLLLIDII